MHHKTSKGLVRKMMHFVAVPIALIALFLFLVRMVENKLVFFPATYPEGFWQPQQYALQPTDAFFEASDGVKLHGWYFEQENSIATLLIFHGNAGNISHRLHFIAQLKAHLPVNVFIFDYRGYGKSEGSPSESGLYLDARAAYAYLTETLRCASHEIILHGRSLGGAIAIDLAREVDAGGLLLESTFSRGNDMAREMFKFMPVWWLSKIKLDSQAKIAAIDLPLLMFHGRRDRVVPFHLGQKLFEAANEPKQFIEIPKAGHNDVYVVGETEFFPAIQIFLEQTIAGKE